MTLVSHTVVRGEPIRHPPNFVESVAEVHGILPLMIYRFLQNDVGFKSVALRTMRDPERKLRKKIIGKLDTT